jgi:hypothetical protein
LVSTPDNPRREIAVGGDGLTVHFLNAPGLVDIGGDPRRDPLGRSLAQFGAINKAYGSLGGGDRAAVLVLLHRLRDL